MSLKAVIQQKIRSNIIEIDVTESSISCHWIYHLTLIDSIILFYCCLIAEKNLKFQRRAKFWIISWLARKLILVTFSVHYSICITDLNKPTTEAQGDNTLLPMHVEYKMISTWSTLPWGWRDILVTTNHFAFSNPVEGTPWLKSKIWVKHDLHGLSWQRWKINILIPTTFEPRWILQQYDY